jgi:RNA polymerase sigma-70 factor, ECF subfamily
VLRYYLGLSEAEIAAMLGISTGTVKSTAARALAAMGRDLGEES